MSLALNNWALSVKLSNHCLLTFSCSPWKITKSVIGCCLIDICLHLRLTFACCIVFSIPMNTSDCGYLRSLKFGKVDITQGTTYTKVATYSCNTGYRLRGGSTRICQASGQWSLSQSYCDIVGKNVFWPLFYFKICTWKANWKKQKSSPLQGFSYLLFWRHVSICLLKSLTISRGVRQRNHQNYKV